MADGKDLMSTDIRDALFAVFFDNSILVFSYMSKNLLFLCKISRNGDLMFNLPKYPR